MLWFDEIYLYKFVSNFFIFVLPWRANLYTTYLEKIWPSETEILYCASIVLWFSQSNICSSNLYIEYHDRNEDFGKNFQLCQSIRIYVLNFKFLGQQLQLTCYFLKKDTKVSKNFEFSNLKFQVEKGCHSKSSKFFN